MTAATRSREAPFSPAQHATVASVFLDRARRTPDRTAFFHRVGGTWTPVTWREYRRNVARALLAMRDSGVRAGDRVAIHAANRPEWLYADLAAEALGAIVVGAYPTCSPADLRQLLEDSGARLLVTDDISVLAAALAPQGACPALETCVLFDARQDAAGRRIVRWPQADTNPAGAEEALEAAAAQVRAEDASCIIYTSGTTGSPKGAVLTHRNAVTGAVSMAAALGMDSGDVTVAYLPLCHLAERNLTHYVAPLTGHVFYFAASAKTVQDDIREVRPTFVGAVPRMLQKMRDGIELAAAKSAFTALKHRVCLRLGTGVLRRRMASGYRLRPLDRMLFALADQFHFRALRRRLGMERVRHCIAGTAPVPPDIMEYFHAIGVPFRQSYGQTEAGGATHMSQLETLRFDAIGPACPGYDFRIDAATSEVLVRGDAVFTGYWNRPDATRETIRDGWLHTGDLGSVSDDGQLRITGRIKDIIITAGGKNISPARIENRLRQHPLIKDAIVVGEGRPYLTALLVVDPEGAPVRNPAPGTDTRPREAGAIAATIQGWIDTVNADLARVETIKKFRCLPRDLDLAQGELTMTQKVRRQAVARNFDHLIREMYA